jgi:molecular chaperone DnaK (HSP70)
MLRAVDVAFSQMGDAIDRAEKEKIQRAAAEVRQALESHDARKLKSANDALDHTTQSLAAAIVEKAMRATQAETHSGSAPA